METVEQFEGFLATRNFMRSSPWPVPPADRPRSLSPRQWPPRISS